MSKPSPESTGQADASAQNQIWQGLISQEEAYQDSQNQQQRGAAASLDQPDSGLNNAGTSRPNAQAVQGGSVPQQGAPVTAAATPLQAPPPQQVNAGSPPPVNAFQHAANAISPGARASSGQMPMATAGGPSDAQAAQAATQNLQDPSQQAPAAPQGQNNWQMTPQQPPQKGGFFPPLSPQQQQQILGQQNGANQP